MQVCFSVSNVQSPLIRLPDINNNSKTTIHQGVQPYIEQFGNNEQLLHIGTHLHMTCMVLPGFYNPNEIQLGQTIHTRYSRTSPTTLIVGDVEELSQQTNIPRQLKQPAQLTKQEREEHRITHMPYRSYRFGAQAVSKPKDNPHTTEKARSNNHGYNWTMSTSDPTNRHEKKWQVHTILTGVETTTGQGAVERFHKTLFAQCRALRFDLVDRYLVHADGQTTYQRRWGLQYNSVICNFGEIVLADIKPITVDNEQGTKAIWLGKTTNSGEHSVATKDNTDKERVQNNNGTRRSSTPSTSHNLTPQ
eukprot:3736773-Amphidinium_carterae.2